jgi:hypothetical protein
MSQGAVAAAMMREILAGGAYPPDGVPDTPANRTLWDQIGRDIESLPDGVVPDLPADWAEMSDD